MTAKDTTRIDYFNSVVKYKKTDSCRLQQIDMNQSVLKKFFQYGFWYFEATNRIERLVALYATKTGLEPHHGLFIHLRYGSFYVAAVLIFCS